MKYICIRKNFWGGKLWRPGDRVDVDPQGAESSTVRTHFRPDPDGVPDPVATEPVVPPSGAVDAPAPAPEAEHSNVRDNLKHLCLRSGVVVTARMSLKAMRDALAAKGIVVS